MSDELIGEEYLKVILPKRILRFEEIQAEQIAHYHSIGGDPIKIKLPDGTIKEGKKWLTSPKDVASEISVRLASEVLIAKMNETLWDITRPLEGDCELTLFKFDDKEGRDTFWHSSAHILGLGQSLELQYGCKLCIGPCTTRGEGFYYDAFYGDDTLNEDDFDKIKSRVEKAVEEKQPFERIEVSRKQALEIFAENKFKVELINELSEDKTITVYRCGPLVDLCRGPHIPNTSFVKAFTCLKVSSSYWRGNADRESLQRVYDISFLDKKCLKVRDQIHQVGYYVDVDTSDRKIQKKIREAQLAQYNYILVVGEKEFEHGQVSVRIRDQSDISMKNISPPGF